MGCASVSLMTPMPTFPEILQIAFKFGSEIGIFNIVDGAREHAAVAGGYSVRLVPMWEL